MSLYSAIPQTTKMLINLSAWLDKAGELAEQKSFDVETLLTSRLSPDQFNLTRQIQSVCDAAKFMVARTTGRTAPSNPDTETTLAELRTRIQVTLDYLATYSAADFEGIDDNMVPLPFLPIPDVGLSAADYLNEMAVPNFHFHLVTAYAILRHNGVSIGKRDYIGSLNLKPTQSS